MSYNIPRNVKGEGRILYVFSYKALLYTGVGILVGLIFYFILSILGLKMIGYIVIGVCAFIGFGIGTFKLPNIVFLKGARLAAGDSIDDVIIRAIKFKMNKNKYYIYMDEESKENVEEKGGTKDGE